MPKRADPSLLRAWLGVAAWAALVLFAGSQDFSADTTSRFIEPVVRWLHPGVTAAQLAAIHFFVRKGAHVVEYGVLALLALQAWYRSLRGAWAPAAAIALALTLAVAVADESRQSKLSSRTGAATDVGLDGAGGLAAIAAAGIWRHARRSRRRSARSRAQAVGDGA